MSRAGDGWDEPDYQNAGDLWEANVRRALRGKRGQKALRELREALLNLPTKRLIERALCTYGPDERRPDSSEAGRWAVEEFDELVEDQGQGVCAVGAYVWWQKVKAGMDPAEAFAALPTYPDTDTDLFETAYLGKQHGLTFTLAWDLAHRNDELFGGITAEERYSQFLAWLDKMIVDEVPA